MFISVHGDSSSATDGVLKQGKVLFLAQQPHSGVNDRLGIVQVYIGMNTQTFFSKTH